MYFLLGKNVLEFVCNVSKFVWFFKLWNRSAATSWFASWNRLSKRLGVSDLWRSNFDLRFKIWSWPFSPWSPTLWIESHRLYKKYQNGRHPNNHEDFRMVPSFRSELENTLTLFLRILSNFLKRWILKWIFKMNFKIFQGFLKLWFSLIVYRCIPSKWFLRSGLAIGHKSIAKHLFRGSKLLQIKTLLSYRRFQSSKKYRKFKKKYWKI